jgi:hypothetical protein
VHSKAARRRSCNASSHSGPYGFLMQLSHGSGEKLVLASGVRIAVQKNIAGQPSTAAQSIFSPVLLNRFSAAGFVVDTLTSDS